MNRRQKVICNAFADWSERCREEFTERFLVSQEAKLTERISSDALVAYMEFKLAAQGSESDNEDALKEEFWRVAAEYFSLRVLHGLDWINVRLTQREMLEEKWRAIIESIDACETFVQLGNYLRSRPKLFVLLEDILEVRAKSLNALKTKLKVRLKRECDREIELEFGFKNSYLWFGKEAALSHFDEMVPKSAGRKPKEFSPDAYRARAFVHILNDTNAALERSHLKKTNWKEICEVTLGVGSNSSEFERADSIRWVYKDYFRARNISVPGLLNSLSRGRRRWSELGIHLS